MTTRPKSQADRLLEVLRDGRWHPSSELYALGMIVHSRVAELRKAGYLIETKREGRGAENFYYRLSLHEGRGAPNFVYQLGRGDFAYSELGRAPRDR